MIYTNLNPEKALIWRIVHRDNLPWILDKWAALCELANAGIQLGIQTLSLGVHTEKFQLSLAALWQTTYHFISRRFRLDVQHIHGARRGA